MSAWYYECAMFEYVNEVSIVVSALLAVAVGNVWYSPLVFGNAWLRSMGKEPGSDVLNPKEMYVATIKGVCAHVVFFFVLAYVSYVTREVLSLTQLGAIVTFLIAFPYVLGTIWEQRPFVYVLIQIGYAFVTVYGGLSIITFWPW